MYVVDLGTTRLRMVLILGVSNCASFQVHDCIRFFTKNYCATLPYFQNLRSGVKFLSE